MTKPVDFHSWRHRFVQALADMGMSAQLAQKLAGHADLSAHERYLQTTTKTLTIPAAALPTLRVSWQPCTILKAAYLETPCFPARPRGFEPLTTGFEEDDDGLAAASNELQESDIVQVGIGGRVQGVAKKAANRRQLVTTLLQATAGNRAISQGEERLETIDHGSQDGVRLMTVKEVAAVLRVCTATVYDMIERGELGHVRVSNAIRIVVRDTT